ncbi:MAG: glycosyltransferase [Pseudomonadota bacterium]
MQPKRRSDPTRFDAAFYLSEYPDIARKGVDPETHYRTVGWREGRDPSPLFSTDFYLETYPDIRAAGIDPLQHFAQFGQSEGRAISPSRSLSGAFNDRLQALLASEPPASALPKDDADLLGQSRFFHGAHYARLSGASGSRAALVAHYLACPVAQRVSPHPCFAPDFYRATYLGGETETETATETETETETDSLLDYLRVGRARNRYPSALAAQRDIALIAESSGFDPTHYERSLQGRMRFDDPVRDYVLHGQERGGQPMAGFDAAFVASVYMRRAEAACAPLAYYLRNRSRPWIFQSLGALFPVYAEIWAARLFDPAYYAAAAGIDARTIDPALHYVLRGVPAGHPCSPDFHTGFYLEQNRDIAQAQINPLLHFERHGMAEGRAGIPATPPARVSGRVPDAGGRPLAIIVSHEASMTGAPIVALNIARALSQTHDVIAWLGRDGPLSADFAACAVAVIHGMPPAGDAAGLLEKITARRNIAFAIVNSALSGAALEPLQRVGIAAMLLVHDFATYVYPRGTLSRLVLNAPISVFPAQVVADAQAVELSLLGAPAPPAGVHIAHQGWNDAAKADRATLDIAALRRMIDAPEGGGQTVIFGGGWVQPRKGVDIFVQTAARLCRIGGHDWRFVWVGDNYKPESDMLLSVYLADHIAQSGLVGRFFFLDSLPDLDPVWAVTDVFLLSSRLDPYPNIALDALVRNIPVVCFRGATGIADLAEAFPFAVRPVAFADPTDAAEAVADLADKADAVAAAFARARARLMDELSFTAYVARLTALADAAAQETARRADIARLLAGRPAAELRAALATVPDWARITRAESRAGMALTLAALQAAGGPMAQSAITAETPIELHPRPDPLLRLAGGGGGGGGGGLSGGDGGALAVFEDASVLAAEADRAVHLHVPTGATLPAGLEAVAKRVPLFLTAPRGRFGLERLPDGAVLLPDAAHNALEGLRLACAEVQASWLTHLHAGMTGDALAQRLLDADAAVFAEASADVALILPSDAAPIRPHRAEARYRAEGGEAIAGPIAPALAGHHRTAVLAAFLATEATDSPAAPDPDGARHAPPLSSLETAALLAFRHAAFLRKQRLATLLFVAPETGLVEPPVFAAQSGMLPAAPPALGPDALRPIIQGPGRLRPAASLIGRLRKKLASPGP